MSYIDLLRLCCFLAETSFFKWKGERWKGKCVFFLFISFIFDLSFILWQVGFWKLKCEKWKVKVFFVLSLSFLTFHLFCGERGLEIEKWKLRSERYASFFLKKSDFGKCENFKFSVFPFSLLTFPFHFFSCLWKFIAQRVIFLYLCPDNIFYTIKLWK